MKKVYIVTQGSYSDYHIVNVFSTKEKADTYVKECGGDINEFELDLPRNEWWEITIRMRKDGEIKDKYSFDREYHTYSKYQASHFCCYDTYGNFVYSVVTDDEKIAIKVTNEKRAIILANDAWLNEPKTRELLNNEQTEED